MLLELLEYFLDTFSMLGKVVGVDKNVVQIDDNQNID